MMMYGIGWWRARFFWRLHLLMGYLMTPCWEMKAADWVDTRVLHRWCVLKFYDTWTLRLHIMSYGWWREAVYGPGRGRAMSFGVPSGIKSLIQILNALEALHGQVLNIPDERQQYIGTYGIMVPRWAATPETTEADARALMVDVVRRRAMQSVPICDAIRVVRALIKEYGLSQDIPASELTHPTDCITCKSEGTVPGWGQPCIKCGAVREA